MIYFGFGEPLFRVHSFHSFRGCNTLRFLLEVFNTVNTTCLPYLSDPFPPFPRIHCKTPANVVLQEYERRPVSYMQCQGPEIMYFHIRQLHNSLICSAWNFEPRAHHVGVLTYTAPS